jgi:hypothetical protein
MCTTEGDESMVEKLIVLLMAIVLVNGIYSAMEKQADITTNIYTLMEVPK